MPTFSVSHRSRLAAGTAFARVSELVENEPQFRQLDPDYQCEFDPAEYSGSANSRYFTADMAIETLEQGCNVTLEISLPTKYTLAKGMIKKALLKKLRSEL